VATDDLVAHVLEGQEFDEVCSPHLAGSLGRARQFAAEMTWRDNSFYGEGSAWGAQLIPALLEPRPQCVGSESSRLALGVRGALVFAGVIMGHQVCGQCHRPGCRGIYWALSSVTTAMSCSVHEDELRFSLGMSRPALRDAEMLALVLAEQWPVFAALAALVRPALTRAQERPRGTGVCEGFLAELRLDLGIREDPFGVRLLHQVREFVRWVSGREIGGWPCVAVEAVVNLVEAWHDEDLDARRAVVLSVSAKIAALEWNADTAGVLYVLFQLADRALLPRRVPVTYPTPWGPRHWDVTVFPIRDETSEMIRAHGSHGCLMNDWGFLADLPPAPRVVDLGAAGGDCLVPFEGLFPEAVLTAVEPSDECRSVLRRNLSPRVRVIAAFLVEDAEAPGWSERWSHLGNLRVSGRANSPGLEPFSGVREKMPGVVPHLGVSEVLRVYGPFDVVLATDIGGVWDLLRPFCQGVWAAGTGAATALRGCRWHGVE